MPRGEKSKGNPNITQYGKETRFTSGCGTAGNDAKKAGTASGQSKRKKKRALEAADVVAKRILNMDAMLDEDSKTALAAALDIPPDALNMMHMMFIGVANGIKKRGDVDALDKLLNMAGMGGSDSNAPNPSESINSDILSLAELIQHPLPNRTISEVENDAAEGDGSSDD